MYQAFFGLRERPFDLTPNPRFLYLTGRHREALSILQYGISARKGVTLLTGEAGTGKTTILRAAIDALSSPNLRCVYVNNPVLTRPEFYEFLAPRFGLGERARASKAQFLSELEQQLFSERRGRATALIVDEAQSLPHELMEEVRLLANLETEDEKLLQVVMAGQPELAERLEHEDLRQLKQRVALRCELLPLDVRETAAYISGRIAIAGGQAARIFTREAVQLIYDYSGGIPRTISVLCDNAMVTAFAAGTLPVGATTVLEVCRDFRLATAATAPPKTTDAAGAREPAVDAPTPAWTPAAGGQRRAADGARPAAAIGRQLPRPEPAEAESVHEEEEAAARAVAGAKRHQGEHLFSMFTKKKRFRFF